MIAKLKRTQKAYHKTRTKHPPPQKKKKTQGQTPHPPTPDTNKKEVATHARIQGGTGIPLENHATIGPPAKRHFDCEPIIARLEYLYGPPLPSVKYDDLSAPPPPPKKKKKSKFLDPPCFWTPSPMTN